MYDQRRRLEAEDCDSIRCAQLISGGRRRTGICPPHCLAHARPTMCCIRLVIVIIIMYRLASLWPAIFSPTGYGLLMHCSKKQHICSIAWHYYTLSVVHDQHCEFQITWVSLKRGIKAPCHATLLQKKKDVRMHASHVELLFTSVLSSY